MNIKDIDVNFDFTTDTKGFWDGFWERNDGLGAGGADPDSKSKTLRLYSQLLWSKALPNGEVMQLEDGKTFILEMILSRPRLDTIVTEHYWIL